MKAKTSIYPSYELVDHNSLIIKAQCVEIFKDVIHEIWLKLV